MMRATTTKLLLGIALILSATTASANTDLTLSNKPMFLKVQLPSGEWRDVNVTVVEEIAGPNYAIAVGADKGWSRCLVYIERRHLQYLWHELDHCRHFSHPGESER